jgi:hypothetical protein
MLIRFKNNAIFFENGVKRTIDAIFVFSQFLGAFPSGRNQ